MPSRDVMGTALRGRRLKGTKGAPHRNTNAVSHGSYRNIFDGRTRDAKEIKTTVANWIQDLGGFNSLSSMQLTILQDLAIIAWRTKRLGRVIVRDDERVREKNTRDFLRFHRALVDGLSKLGLQRQAKNIDAELDALRKKYTYSTPAIVQPKESV